jgi:hypothetical protein
VPAAPFTCPKAAVSVSEMAGMCGGMSRSRFYELVKAGVMPSPVYDLATRRPIFTRELQELCLQVRATNVGVNGRFILFYSRRMEPGLPATPRTRGRRSRAATAAVDPSLMEAIRSLGLQEIGEPEVYSAIQTCFPTGTEGVDEGALVRAVWRHLRRSDGAR